MNQLDPHVEPEVIIATESNDQPSNPESLKVFWEDTNVETSMSVTEILSRFDITSTGQWYAISPLLNQQIETSTDISLQLKEASKEMEVLASTIISYNSSMAWLSENNKSKKSRWGLGSKLPVDVNSFTRKIGRWIPNSFSQQFSEKINVFTDLENGGLEDLRNQLQNTLDSVWDQHNSLLAAQNECEKYLQNKQDDLAVLKNVLELGVSESEQQTIRQRIESLETDTIIYTAKLQAIVDAIKFYKASVVQLVIDTPKALDHLSTAVMTYRIAQTAEVATDVTKWLRDMANKSITTTFDNIANVWESVWEVVDTAFIQDQTLQKIVDQSKRIGDSSTKLALSSDAAKKPKKPSALLQQLKKSNNQ